MKNFLVGLLTISPFFVGLSAEEFKKGVYGYFDGGIGKYSDLDVLGTNSKIEYETGFGYEIGLGYDFGKRFRTEIIYANQQSNIDTILGINASGDFDFSTFALMGYIDFPTSTNWSPFIGVGIGNSDINYGQVCLSTGVCATSTAEDFTSYSLALGTSYKLNSSTDVVGKFTYRGFSDINFSDNTTVEDSETITTSVGLRFYF